MLHLLEKDFHKDLSLSTGKKKKVQKFANSIHAHSISSNFPINCRKHLFFKSCSVEKLLRGILYCFWVNLPIAIVKRVIVNRAKRKEPQKSHLCRSFIHVCLICVKSDTYKIDYKNRTIQYNLLTFWLESFCRLLQMYHNTLIIICLTRVRISVGHNWDVLSIIG